jgi:CRP-like cAMP-binding protein
LQFDNEIPKKCHEFCAETPEEMELTSIDILESGEIFGEIGVLTNMVRTASVHTLSICLFTTLNIEDVQKIKKKFPLIFNKLYSNMQNYIDEDMT